MLGWFFLSCVLYQNEGKYDAALSSTRGRWRFVKALSAGSPRCRGCALQPRRRYRARAHFEAQPLYERALSIGEKALGPITRRCRNSEQPCRDLQDPGTL